ALLPAGGAADGRAVRRARRPDARQDEPRAADDRGGDRGDGRARDSLDHGGRVPRRPDRAAVAPPGADPLDHGCPVPSAALARPRRPARLSGDRERAPPPPRRQRLMDRERLLKLLPWISTPVLLVLIIG